MEDKKTQKVNAFYKPNGPKTPVNQSQFDAIRAGIKEVIGTPAEIEALEYWEGPDTGLDITVSGGEVSIRVAGTHHVDHDGNVVRN